MKFLIDSILLTFAFFPWSTSLSFNWLSFTGTVGLNLPS